jgi:hypothetical protein
VREVIQDELVLDTGVAKLADFGLSKTIASLAPKIREGSKLPRQSESSGTPGVEASCVSLASATARGANGSKHKIVQLVSPSRKGTFDGYSQLLLL